VSTVAEPALSEAAAWRALAEVMDPELPLSVVDLGLIYALRVEGGDLEVDMTLTSMGCPCHEWIVGDVREQLATLASPGKATVRVVWDPPWTRERISAAGRRALSKWGVSS
jgi:metal-sulfur cluster biosynthetic enzyme